MPALTLRLKSGDHRTVRITVMSDDGVTPQDLTGVTVRFQVAREIEQPAVISKSSAPGGDVTIVNAAGGVIDVAFVPVDTDDLAYVYVYEMELEDSGGRLSTVYFPIERRYYSHLYIEPDLIVETA